MAPHIFEVGNRGESGQFHVPERNPLQLTKQEALKHELPLFLRQNRFRYCALDRGAQVRK